MTDRSFLNACGKMGILRTARGTVYFCCSQEADHLDACGTRLIPQEQNADSASPEVTWGNYVPLPDEKPDLRKRCSSWLFVESRFVVFAERGGKPVEFWCELTLGHSGPHIRSHRLEGGTPLILSWN